MFAEVTQFKYANFRQRLLALILDAILIGVPSFCISLYLTAPFFLDETTLQNASETNFEFLYQVNKSFIYFILVALAVAGLVATIFSRSNWHATPGKKIVGIYIIGKNGEKPGGFDMFGRYVSLPLFLLMVQIFQRQENYIKLDQLHHTKPMATMTDLMHMTPGPVTQITSLVTLTVICFWYLRIIFSPQKAALHDILFNTRVIAK